MNDVIRFEIWNVLFSTTRAGQMIEKLFELVPKWIEVKVVVGTKYCKLLDREINPVFIEEICAKKIAQSSK